MVDVGDVVHLPGRDLHAIAVVGPALPQLRRISHIGSADTGQLGRVLIKRALAECPLLGVSGRGR